MRSALGPDRTPDEPHGSQLRITKCSALNRAVDEWIALFDDPILAQSAVDRLANNAYQIVMEGDTYRGKLRPGRADAPAVAALPRNGRRGRRAQVR